MNSKATGGNSSLIFLLNLHVRIWNWTLDLSHIPRIQKGVSLFIKVLLNSAACAFIYLLFSLYESAFGCCRD